MKRLYSSALVAVLALSGCTDNNVKPQQDDAALTAVQDAEKQAVAAPQSSAQPAVTATDFERLESRFSLAQEQLLGLISQSAQTRDSNNRLLLQLQAIQNTLSEGAALDEGEGDATMGGYDTAALDAVLEQLLLVANDLGGNSGANTTPFAMSMAYIGSGKWKVIRYNRSTGETWLARGNDWELLLDSEVLPESSYEVKMISGEDLLVQQETDSTHKGFIAARLDRTSGRMWWLNKNRWQAFGR